MKADNESAKADARNTSNDTKHQGSKASSTERGQANPESVKKATAKAAKKVAKNDDAKSIGKNKRRC